MSTPYRRQPDDDDEERPSPSRRLNRPADDDKPSGSTNPPSGQRPGTGGWGAPRPGSERLSSRDSGSSDDFNFVRDRVGDRRPSTRPGDKEDDEDEDEGRGLGGFLRRSKKPEDQPTSKPPSRTATGERPAAPTGRFPSANANRDRDERNKGNEEEHKSRGLGGILGRGSKDKEDKDKDKDAASSRRSPFLGSGSPGGSGTPGGSSPRDSQRRPATPFGSPRQPIGANDDDDRSSPSSRLDAFRNRDQTSSPNRPTTPYGDRTSSPDRTSPYGDRTGSPDRTSPYGDRTGSPDRSTSSYDRDRLGTSTGRPPGSPTDRPGQDRSGSPTDRDRLSPDRSTSPYDRDRPGGDRPTSSFDRDRLGTSTGRPPGSPLDRSPGSTFGDRPGTNRPDASRDRSPGGPTSTRPEGGSGVRDFNRRETGGDLAPRSASQTRSFPPRPAPSTGKKEDEKKDEPHKSRLGGLLGGSKPKKEEKPTTPQTRSGSAVTGTRPGQTGNAVSGTRSSQTTNAARPSAIGTTSPSARRGFDTASTTSPTTDAKRRSQVSSTVKDTPASRRGTAEPKSRAATPSTSTRAQAKPLPGKEKGAFTLSQGLDYERKIDLIGVALIGFALVAFFAVIPSISMGLLPESRQGMTGALNHLLSQMFGWGKIVWPLVAGGIGIWLMRESFAGRGFELDFFRIVGMVMLYTCLLTWLQMFQSINHTAPTVEAFRPISYNLAVKQGEGGGWIGHTIYVFLLSQLLDWGTVSVLLAWLVISVMLTFDRSVIELWGHVAGVFSVFTITSAQREQKRASREALAAEVMAAMRPGEEGAPASAGRTAGAAAAAALPARGAGRQPAAAGETPAGTAPAGTMPAPTGRRGATRAQTTAAAAPDAALTGSRAPGTAAETPTGDTAPDRLRSSPAEGDQAPTRTGPVINRRTGLANGDTADNAASTRPPASSGFRPLPETPGGEAKTGEKPEDSAASLGRRRLPHFRGTEDAEAVSDSDQAAAGTPGAADASKPDAADAGTGRRALGGLFRRGGSQSGDQETPAPAPAGGTPSETPAARKPGDTAGSPAAPASATPPADPLARRSPFARPIPAGTPDSPEASRLPGIPVPPRSSTPTASTEDSSTDDNKPSVLGRFRRNPDTPAGTAASSEAAAGPNAASAPDKPAPEGDKPVSDDTGLSGLGRWQRKSAPTGDTPPETPNSVVTPTPDAAGSDTSKPDQAGRGGRFGRLLPGLRRSSGTEQPSEDAPETDSGLKPDTASAADATVSSRPSLTADLSPTASPAAPERSFGRTGLPPRENTPVLGPSRPARSPLLADSPRADTPGTAPSADADRPENPGARRTSDLMKLAPRNEPDLAPSRRTGSPFSGLRDKPGETKDVQVSAEPENLDGPDKENKKEEDAPEDDEDKPTERRERPGLGTMAVLGAAGAAALDRVESRREERSIGTNRFEHTPFSRDRSEPARPPAETPGPGLRPAASPLGRTPASALDEPADKPAETSQETPAASPAEARTETPPSGEKPAQPAYLEGLRRRPLGEDRPRPGLTPPEPPPAASEEAADAPPAAPPLAPARPVGIDALRRPPLTPSLRSSEKSPDESDASPNASKPGEIGAAAPIQSPAILRRSPLITPDRPEPAVPEGGSPPDNLSPDILSPGSSPHDRSTPGSPPLGASPRGNLPPKVDNPASTARVSPPPGAALTPDANPVPGARPSPFAGIPARPALTKTEGEAEPPAAVPTAPSRPPLAPPQRPGPAVEPPKTEPAKPETAAALGEKSELPPRRPPVFPPARPAAPLDDKDQDEADLLDDEAEFDEDNFEEVDDEPEAKSATRSILGTRPSAAGNVPAGRPSIVRRGSSPDHPAAPPSPTPARQAPPPAPPLVRHAPEPAAAVASGTNSPEIRSTAQRGKNRYDPPDFRTLLRRGDEKRINDEILLDKARVIEDTLVSFGAPGKVVEVNPGPVITQFGVEPDYVLGRAGRKMRVKVGAIARLDADLALALAAKSIRIEAPVPGKGFVGIEVPNDEVSLVGLYDIMDSPEFNKIDSRLSLALGLAVDGSPVAADLTAMPHLLIAGTTGSGKSVCVNSIIACLLLHNSPQDVQFIMVDPKRVELTGYNGIPHLVAPVVVDLERIVGVLQWVQREMEERYRKFASISARNILDYNSKLGPDGQKLPYYVVVVDELADLMMLAPDETERLLARLAQMARATGIHLIISTQRPSVDIITGLIKANFPARIAFAVASSVDSRVILDQPGAEKLLGRGDMLFQSPDAAAPLRMQGVYVSDEEINRITSYWKGLVLQKADAAGERDVLASPSRELTITRSALDTTTTDRTRPATTSAQRALWDDEAVGGSATDGESKGDDELYQEAVDLVQRLGKASISLLQRRLRIGYTRSARLIDLMEEDGIVGPAESGSKPREVLKLKPSSRAGAKDTEE